MSGDVVDFWVVLVVDEGYFYFFVFLRYYLLSINLVVCVINKVSMRVFNVW